MVIADLVDKFSKTYKDAGRIIGIALGVPEARYLNEPRLCRGPNDPVWYSWLVDG